MVTVDYEDPKFRVRLGKLLRRLRTEKYRVSEKEMASACKSSINTIKKIESGEKCKEITVKRYCGWFMYYGKDLKFKNDIFPDYLYEFTEISKAVIHGG